MSTSLLVRAATAIFIPAELTGGIIIANTPAEEQQSNLIELRDSIPAPAKLLKRDADATTSTAAPSPTQPGLISTCNSYYLVKQGDYCSTIISKFNNFTLSQFYTWNHAVKSDCSQLLAGYYVCIGVSRCSSKASELQARADPTPTPTQSGIASNCNNYYEVVSGDTCIGIASRYGVTFSQFYNWNPAVGSNCQLLLEGYYVCVGVSPTMPSPTQPGVTSDCIQYYEARSGDTCVSIVQKYSSYLTLSLFESWNPAVGNDCTELLVGYWYCVATKSVHG
ncbi:LysM domain protein, putative [Talaromyces stipitatus ATCC 10500]|uniref:LysM domain protein, putative n=1 Tax=Talaromyces stipitatus (strain ATCC 10500 / CBS 375.48 / QM 6759 / NRRL 1006) TaxID=441959 RepID=B8M0R6_TALSN|nr:LysM domain protein, putative [Talaromyces stipitatus ATCC 10500]EED21449.1 LysM domain protein, putative [Talaromyces stipitatus ATCC 10500]